MHGEAVCAVVALHCHQEGEGHVQMPLVDQSYVPTHCHLLCGELALVTLLTMVY